MGMMDKFKRMVSLPPEEDYEDENFEGEEEKSFFTPKKQQSEEEPAKAKSESFFGKSSAKNTSNGSASQIQVVLVKPSRFEDAPSIADYLNENKTVVLNLENANREISRRLIDFLSGTAYARKGNIKKVAHSTYIITPANVDVLGDLILDDIENAMYLG